MKNKIDYNNILSYLTVSSLKKFTIIFVNKRNNELYKMSSTKSNN